MTKEHIRRTFRFLGPPALSLDDGNGMVTFRLRSRLALGVLAISLGLPPILFGQDFLGILVLYAAAGVLLGSRLLRRNAKALAACLLVLLVYSITAVVGSFFFDLPGSEADASRFLRQATFYASVSQLPEYHGGASVYVGFLSIIFSAFGPSKFAALALNAFAVSLTLLAVCNLRAKLAGEGRVGPGFVLLFGLLPSALLFRSAILREAWEGLFFSLAVLFLCQISIRASVRSLAFFLVFGLLGAALHSALAIFLVSAGPIVAIVRALTGEGSALRRAILVIGSALLVLPIGAMGALTAVRDNRVEKFSTTLISEGGGEALGGLQGDGRGGATYAHAPGMTGNPLLRIPAGLIYYWLAPFPWQFRSGIDLLAFLENLLRVALFVSAIFGCKRIERTARAGPMTAIACVFVLELIWSAGTSNWGTALRHHIPAFGVLCAVGWPLTFPRKVDQAKREPSRVG